MPAFQAGEAGSTPAGHFEDANTIPGSSLLVVMPDSGTDAKRWSQESVGSIPTPGTKQQLRDRLTVGRDALNVLMLVRFQLPQLKRCKALVVSFERNVWRLRSGTNN